MYARLLGVPTGSSFLFGPRGTGKSTWISTNLPDAVTYNLLDAREATRLERDPHTLSDELRAAPEGRWVVLDEVQRVPALLDEVHHVIESKRLRFLLCGSSARKLMRGGANLLAGRAVVNLMFPLTSAELGSEFDPEASLVRGTLPLVVMADDPDAVLDAYALTYLSQEIRAEALTRNVGAFSRFLEVAARQSGQITNMSNISRETSVARSTVQTYFDILEDTLLGYWVPAWRLKRSNKQHAHPKFYFFDTGVSRALCGRLPYPPTAEELGALLETLLLNEIRAYLAYHGLRYRPFYWRTYDGTEVDLLCETSDGYVAVEMKSVTRWQSRYGRGLLRLHSELRPKQVTCYGVYRGSRPIAADSYTVFPVSDFLNRLWQGEILR